MQVQVDKALTMQLPVLHASGMLINFTGFEFIVTVFSALPEPWISGEQMNLDVKAKPLGRYVISPQQWVGFVASANQMLEKLREEGVELPSADV